MPARRFPLFVGVALSLALLLTGCSGPMGGSDTSAASESAADGEAGGADTEQALPAGTLAFKAKTLAGQDLDVATALAGKPTVIWFWAPACQRCLAGAAQVQAAAARFSQQVTFLGVGTDGTVPQLESFVAANGLGRFPHVVDASGSISARFKLTDRPAFAFVGRNGSVLSVQASLTDEQLSERLTELAQP